MGPVDHRTKLFQIHGAFTFIKPNSCNELPILQISAHEQKGIGDNNWCIGDYVTIIIDHIDAFKQEVVTSKIKYLEPKFHTYVPPTHRNTIMRLFFNRTSDIF